MAGPSSWATAWPIGRSGIPRPPTSSASIRTSWLAASGRLVHAAGREPEHGGGSGPPTSRPTGGDCPPCRSPSCAARARREWSVPISPTPADLHSAGRVRPPPEPRRDDAVEAQVPQPITHSASRFGPLTLPQLGWCTAAGAAPFLLLVRCHLPLGPGALLSLPTTVGGLAAAFVRPEGRSASEWVADWARFRRQPRELHHPASSPQPDGEGWWPVDLASPTVGGRARRCG